MKDGPSPLQHLFLHAFTFVVLIRASSPMVVTDYSSIRKVVLSRSNVIGDCDSTAKNGSEMIESMQLGMTGQEQ